MRRWVEPEPEPEPADYDDWLDDLMPHGGMWSRSTVAGVEASRCRDHNLTADEH